jgi:hypothetical protein
VVALAVEGNDGVVSFERLLDRERLRPALSGRKERRRCAPLLGRKHGGGAAHSYRCTRTWSRWQPGNDSGRLGDDASVEVWRKHSGRRFRPDTGRRTATQCDAGFGAQTSCVQTGPSGAAIRTAPVGTRLILMRSVIGNAAHDSQLGRGMWRLIQ